MGIDLFTGWLIHPAVGPTAPPYLTHGCGAPTYGRVGVSGVGKEWEGPSVKLAHLVQAAIDHDRMTHGLDLSGLRMAFGDGSICPVELPARLSGWNVDSWRFETIGRAVNVNHNLPCCVGGVTYARVPSPAVTLARAIADASAHLSATWHTDPMAARHAEPMPTATEGGR